MLQKEIEKLVQWMKDSDRTVILTGAGMSTDSGIPDFRSQSGWWSQIDPRTVATVEAFETQYSLFQEFYSFRIKALQDKKPHEGYYILADWERRGLINLIATQNVDGFHKLAGNKRVEELHGDIQSIRCQNCHQKAELNDFINHHPCQKCSGKLRPNVVLFGENLPESSWYNSMKEIKKAELVIVIGTSLEVYPVNQLPSTTSGKIAYINLEISNQINSFNLIIRGKAKDILQKINDSL
nr:NAD-dependent deacylase [Lysinibacillus timonensis]